jgi:RNA polymerase sigma factor (sigma-70 family)
MTEPTLESRIADAGALLAEVARRDAGIALLRFESIDDLVAGMQQEAIRSLPSLAWHGDDAFRGWLLQIARRHLHARRDHWFALKRSGGPVLRLTLSSSTGPSAPGMGPRTFAQRREELAAVTKALGLLPQRDRDLILWSSEGASNEETAERLGITAEAVRKATARALDRLRKTLAIVTAPKGSGGAERDQTQ